MRVVSSGSNGDDNFYFYFYFSIFICFSIFDFPIVRCENANERRNGGECVVFFRVGLFLFLFLFFYFYLFFDIWFPGRSQEECPRCENSTSVLYSSSFRFTRESRGRRDESERMKLEFESSSSGASPAARRLFFVVAVRRGNEASRRLFEVVLVLSRPQKVWDEMPGARTCATVRVNSIRLRARRYENLLPGEVGK